jgi:hypothetical protein
VIVVEMMRTLRGGFADTVQDESVLVDTAAGISDHSDVASVSMH